MSFFESILGASSSKGNVPAELLESIGTKAASMFLTKKVPLNDAIAQLVAENGDLGNEHVKRIAEFANNRAFKELFEKSEDKNVHFDVADPGVILRDMKDGGSPAHDGRPLDQMGDYRSPPMEKREVADNESGLANLFRSEENSGRLGQGEPIEKVASALPSSYVGHANPLDDVHDAYIKLAATRDRVLEANTTLTFMLKTAHDEFAHAVKQEVLQDEGLGIAGVIAALEKVGHDGELITAALTPVVSGLRRGGVDVEANSDLTKVASLRLVNQAHPVVQSFAGVVKTAAELMRSEQALEQVQESLSRTRSYLLEAAR